VGNVFFIFNQNFDHSNTQPQNFQHLQYCNTYPGILFNIQITWIGV